MNIGELCNRNVVVAQPSDSILTAAQLMKRYDVGTVVIAEKLEKGLSPVGILTDRDLVVELLADNIDPSSVTVGDVMSRSLYTATEEEDSFDVLKKMRADSVRRIPVVNNENILQGIVTLDDFIEFLSEEQLDVAAIINKQTKEHSPL